jgi:hypothetical protein
MAPADSRLRRAFRALSVFTLAALGFGGSCDALDYSLPYVVTVDRDAASTPPVVRLFEQPEIGRLALDWSVTNTGVTDSVFVLDVQAQTAGSPDDEACEILDGEPSELIAGAAADAESGEVPFVRDLDRFYRIELASSGAAFDGAVNLRAPSDTVYVLRFDRSSVDISLTTESGLPVVPDLVEVGDGACDAVQTRVTVRLDSGVYRLVITSDSERVGLVATEACTEQRTVSRTCPGEASAIERVDTGLLAPGASITGRVPTSVLGVGDRVAVLLDCSSATPSCKGEGELFVVTEYLECRSTIDCAGNESCSTDGYCVRQPPEGCASVGPSTFGLLALLAARRRRRAA